MCNQQVTLGYGISVLGALLFILGIEQLLPGTPAESPVVSSYLLQMAGWVVSVGWLVQRAEARLWPFPYRGFDLFKLIRKAILEICLPLTLLLMLFIGTLLLVGLLVGPFILFVFQKLF